MRYDVLNQRHECCDLESFEKYEALYRGGRVFKKLIKSFLKQGPDEGSQMYDLRCDDASYQSYVGPIVDFFSAQLFAAPFIVRSDLDGKPSTDGYYPDFRDDVDGVGTNLTSFLKARFTQALVNGVGWWVAEMPDDGGTPPVDKLEWKARGLDRARLVALDPCDVLDWEYDDLGSLSWVITHKREMLREDPRVGRLLVTETWRIYEKDSYETFRISYDPRKKRLKAADEIPSLGVIVHRFARVPVVQMRLPTGMWLMERVADAQVEHFRLNAGLNWALRRTCTPFPVFKCKNQDNPPKQERIGIIIGVDEEFTWAAPDAAPFEVIAAQVSNQKDEIFRVSQQMAASANSSASSMGRSGDSKRADAAATKICLTSYATACKEAIEDTFELVSDGHGDSELHFSIEGLQDFDVDDVAIALDNLAKAMSMSIPSPTLKLEMFSRAASLLHPDISQSVKDQIRKELEEAKDRAVELSKNHPLLPVPNVPPDPGAKPGSSPQVPVSPTADKAARPPS